MYELVLTIGGGILGYLLHAWREHRKEKRIVKQMCLLLRREISSNLAALRELLTILNSYGNADLPEYIKPLSIEEIAERTERACQRESFEAYRRELALLDPRSMEVVFEFYDRSREIPRSFREIERFAGNIRVGLFESNIQYLIASGEAALKAIGA